MRRRLSADTAMDMADLARPDRAARRMAPPLLIGRVTSWLTSLLVIAGFGLSAVVNGTPQVVMPIYDLPIGVETRWASAENPTGAKGQAGHAGAGRKGAASIPVKAGSSVVLAEARGSSGTVRRISITFLDPSVMVTGSPCCGAKMLRSLRIDMYWDGAATPAVSAPLGDFFGFGLGQRVAFDSALFSSPSGRGLNSFVPMPFRSGMRIVVTNEGDADVAALFYSVAYTIGDAHSSGTPYLHAYWHRQSPTRLKEDYEILPRVDGRGRYLGASLGVIVDKATYADTFWGEGEVKIYLDGDTTDPTMAGTGTEDYVGDAFGLSQFAHAYQGSPVADAAAGRFAFYRYHISDPIYFQHDIRVTVQQIGLLLDIADHSRDTLIRNGRRLPAAGRESVDLDLNAGGLFERADDWSSVAYFYLDRPENGLPRLAPVRERVAGLEK